MKHPSQVRGRHEAMPSVIGEDLAEYAEIEALNHGWQPKHRGEPAPSTPVEQAARLTGELIDNLDRLMGRGRYAR